MRKIIFVVIAALILPAVSEAQTKKRTSTTKRTGNAYVTSKRSDCCYGNRWSFEPYAGGFEDPYDISPDGDETGYMVGLRLGYRTGSRTRLSANVAYSSVDNVADPQGLPNYFVYDNTWVFTTVGGEFDVVPGRTSASLGLHGGVAWRRVDQDGEVGTPFGTPISDRGFSSGELIVPSVMLRHRLTNRATISAGLHDHIFDVFEGPARHGIGLSLGVSFR